ncbi:MAG: hypothetical protein D6732_27080 [Methanobacteriota archaeon]|nr:MAG: hypothetical protein D6732_27080 [Euryarchaeota archaeon]
MERKQISLWLPTSLLEKVETYCASTKITRTGLIQKCLEMFFDGEISAGESRREGADHLLMKMREIEKKIDQVLASSPPLRRKPTRKKELGERKQDLLEKETQMPIHERKKSVELPRSLLNYLETGNLLPTQRVSIQETLQALIHHGGSATAKDIAQFRRLKRPESVRRQIEKLERDGIIKRDKTTIPHTFVLSQQYQ